LESHFNINSIDLGKNMLIPNLFTTHQIFKRMHFRTFYYLFTWIKRVFFK